jgi:lactoylglutathione lyase
MRTLHLGLRVADLEPSLAFYRALGYEVVGSVPETSLGRLTMLKLPGDEFVSIELVSGSAGSAVRREDRLSHFVIQVESLDDVLAGLPEVDADVQTHGSPDDDSEFRTAWIVDPDGNRIELVQWPPGHPDGITAADWPGDTQGGAA